jgi:hypothetical protein
MFRRVATWWLSLFRWPAGPGPFPSLAPEKSLELLRLQIEESRNLLVRRPAEERERSVTAGLRVFLTLAVLGLALSLAVHVAATRGHPPSEWAALGLTIGAVVVQELAGRVLRRPVPGCKRDGRERTTLDECLPWTRRVVYGFFGYAVVNLALFLALTLDRGTGREANGVGALRMFSGFGMAWYAAIAATLYSAIVAAGQGPPRHCANGHPVLPWAAYCKTCGASVAEPGAAGSTSNPASLALAGSEQSDPSAGRRTTDGWPFDDAEDVAALTARQVVHRGQPILRVFRDATDGMWQFLPGGPVEMADTLIVSLREVYRIDPSIAELADLPLGWQASRRAAGEPWQRHASG